QAEDGIRDFHVTGVQTCALPIYTEYPCWPHWVGCRHYRTSPHRSGFPPPAPGSSSGPAGNSDVRRYRTAQTESAPPGQPGGVPEIGRASCRERVQATVVAVTRRE